MKKNIQLAVALAIACTAFSCNSSAKQSNDSQCCAATETKAAATLNIDDLLANGETLVGEEVEIDGVCSHLCAHGARKMFLMGDTQTLRIESGELGKFSQECINSIVKVKGVVKEDRVDEAYLQNWESQLAKQVKETHGEDANGCSTEKSARQEVGNTPEERIANFRTRIAERTEKEGKAYLSFYHVVATSYEIQ